MIRVFVVDDSTFARRAIARSLRADPAVTLVGEAASGLEALERIPSAAPDLVTLDVAMPGMNGLEVLKRLLAWNRSLRVLMLSAYTQEGAEATLEALALGAVDFLDKSRFGLMDLDVLGKELVQRIKALVPVEPVGHRGAAPPPGPRGAADLPAVSHCEVCVIGASTGGPAALQQIVERLPVDFPLPIAVVQHMPVGFTGPFAARLDGHCKLKVTEAVEGDRLERGRILIAPAGRHLRLSAGLSAILTPEPADAWHIPSVDVLMRSAARVRPGRAIGILLTGMGDDGADGMTAIRATGGLTIGESEKTCVVYGMPRAAWLRGGASEMLPLPEIADWLAGLRAGSRAGSPARR